MRTMWQGVFEPPSAQARTPFFLMMAHPLATCASDAAQQPSPQLTAASVNRAPCMCVLTRDWIILQI